MENNDNSGEEQNNNTSYDKFKDIAGKTGEAAKKTAGIIYEQSKKIEPRITISFLNEFLVWIKQIVTPEKFNTVSQWFVHHGHTGLIAAQVICIIYGVVAALKLGQFGILITGIVASLLIAILQYTADKFLNAGSDLIKSSPSKLGSAAFPECLALIIASLGCLALVDRARDLQIFVGFGILALCCSVAVIALNPAMVNVSIAKKVRAGEEAMGIMSFLVKLVVCLVPIGFGIGSLIFTVALAWQTIVLAFSTAANASADAGRTVINFIIFCTCLPFASYIGFALFHLVLDLLRAILVLPSKFDKSDK